LKVEILEKGPFQFLVVEEETSLAKKIWWKRILDLYTTKYVK